MFGTVRIYYGISFDIMSKRESFMQILSLETLLEHLIFMNYSTMTPKLQRCSHNVQQFFESETADNLVHDVGLDLVAMTYFCP